MKEKKSSKTTKKEPYKSPNAMEMTTEEYLKLRGEVKSNTMTISMFPTKSPGKKDK